MLRRIILLCAALLLCGCRGYDSATPDTPANREGFENRLGVKPGPDVKGIYVYANQGTSTSFQIRFECAQLTVDTIITGLALTNTAPPASRFHGRTDFPWWRDRDLESLPVHWKSNAKGDYFWFLWYDSKAGEAFFEEYSR